MQAQTPEQAANYWDKQPDAADFNGTPDYGMGGQGGWKCPLDEPSSAPSQSRLDTCGYNNNGAPAPSRRLLFDVVGFVRKAYS